MKCFLTAYFRVYFRKTKPTNDGDIYERLGENNHTTDPNVYARIQTCWSMCTSVCVCCVRRIARLFHCVLSFRIRQWASNIVFVDFVWFFAVFGWFFAVFEWNLHCEMETRRMRNQFMEQPACLAEHTQGTCSFDYCHLPTRYASHIMMPSWYRMCPKSIVLCRYLQGFITMGRGLWPKWTIPLYRVGTQDVYRVVHSFEDFGTLFTGTFFFDRIVKMKNFPLQSVFFSVNRQKKK